VIKIRSSKNETKQVNYVNSFQETQLFLSRKYLFKSLLKKILKVNIIINI